MSAANEKIYLANEALLADPSSVFSIAANKVAEETEFVTVLQGKPLERRFKTSYSVVNESVLKGLADFASFNKLGVLNFASATRPGGGYRSGATAQEEELCRGSVLHKGLITQSSAPFYFKRDIMTSAAQFHPSVLFFRDQYLVMCEPYSCSVITCAAPNARACTDLELKLIPDAFEKHIRFVLQLAFEKGLENLVLGAWGCGVFRNSASMVAEKFSKVLTEYDGVFDHVTIRRGHSFYTDNISDELLDIFKVKLQNKWNEKKKLDALYSEAIEHGDIFTVAEAYYRKATLSEAMALAIEMQIKVFEKHLMQMRPNSAKDITPETQIELTKIISNIHNTIALRDGFIRDAVADYESTLLILDKLLVIFPDNEATAKMKKVISGSVKRLNDVLEKTKK